MLKLSQASEVADEYRGQGFTILATNGCFDIIHAGHIRLFKQIRLLAVPSILFVGLNDDESVRGLKGDGRPVNSVEDRGEILDAMSCVDFVVPFSGRLAATFLAAVRPQIWVKGGDYTRESVDPTELQAVESCGGKLVLVDLLPGRSTTGTIDRLRASEKR